MNHEPEKAQKTNGVGDGILPWNMWLEMVLLKLRASSQEYGQSLTFMESASADSTTCSWKTFDQLCICAKYV